MDLVSIIIPCYNHAQYVSEAIESALAQTYPYYEVIVVDDGSNDGSLDVISNYKDRIKIINIQNSGLSQARNTGITASHGKYILPLDSDDRIDPNYLVKTVPLMGNSRVGVVSTTMQYFGLRGDILPPHSNTLDQAKHSNHIPVCSLIRRSAFDEVGGYKDIYVDTDRGRVVGFEDWCLWIDLLKHGWEIATLNEILFYYRIKSESMITSTHGYENQLKQRIREIHKEIYE